MSKKLVNFFILCIENRFQCMLHYAYDVVYVVLNVVMLS